MTKKKHNTNNSTTWRSKRMSEEEEAADEEVEALAFGPHGVAYGLNVYNFRGMPSGERRTASLTAPWKESVMML
eukprot:9491490-Pyramimonas_sp.AAC.1